MLSNYRNDSVSRLNRDLHKETDQLDKEDEEFWDTLFAQMLNSKQRDKEFLMPINQVCAN